MTGLVGGGGTGSKLQYAHKIIMIYNLCYVLDIVFCCLMFTPKFHSNSAEFVDLVAGQIDWYMINCVYS